jgi:Ca2+-binding RTX toxin-like protein
VVDEKGNLIAQVVENGVLVAEPTQEFRMVTLSFLAGGGDGYPFPDRDVVQLAQEDNAPRTGDADFAPDGSEQDALAEYLAANFSEENPFSEADTPIEEDTRIRNLLFEIDPQFIGGDADDTLYGTDEGNTIAGDLGDDLILGLDGDDILRGDFNKRATQDGTNGGDDIIFGGAGNDRIGGKAGNDFLLGESGDDQIWGDDGDDIIRGGLGNDRLVGDNFSDGQGSDIFILAADEGTDTILDFEVGTDFIGLAGITFEQLSFGAGGEIKVGDQPDAEVLAVLQGVDTTTLTASDFVTA